MRVQLFLVLAAFLCLQVGCLSFKHHLQYERCLQYPIGPISTNPLIKYSIRRSWDQDNIMDLNDYSYSFIDIMDFPQQQFLSQYQQGFFKQIGRDVGQKFIQQFGYMKSRKDRYQVRQYGISSDDFQSTLGSSSVDSYTVQAHQRVTMLKFAAVGSRKEVGGWNVLIDFEDLEEPDRFIQGLQEKVSQLTKEYKLDTQKILETFRISREEIAKHLILGFENPPPVDTEKPIQFQASIVVLSPGQNFLALPINKKRGSILRIIDQVKDRTNCSQ